MIATLAAEIDLSMVKKLALAFFMGVFLIVAVRVMLAKPGRYDKDAMIPLDDEPVEPRAAMDGPMTRDKD
jgi:hypothetical protein